MNRRHFLGLIATLALPACRGGHSGETARFSAWGRQGLRAGEFLRPRAIGVRSSGEVCPGDACAEEVFVIDTTGRVQVFDPAGGYLRGWMVPDRANGTPTDVSFVGGKVIIPDTHNHRILEYTGEGELLASWGTYGSGPDTFIYPTGIAHGGDGNCYISEYGEDAERVHVFDGERAFVRQWGAHGEEAGFFNRAMGIVVDDGGRVFVVDTANHRVQCFSADGSLLGIFGGVGEAPGRLKYPHDIALGSDGTVFVVEYGNHRVSRFTGEGEHVACYGVAGRGLGAFSEPRGVAVSQGGVVYVADTENHRVQFFRPVDVVGDGVVGGTRA